MLCFGVLLCINKEARGTWGGRKYITAYCPLYTLIHQICVRLKHLAKMCFRSGEFYTSE